ncbi:MAG: hypothetical protein ACJZ78_03355 [Prochlorococcus marinus]
MSKASSPTKKHKVQSIASTLIKITCDKCGGNGYMKTSANCYHTCLPCLGKGFVEVQKQNIN